MQSSVLTHEAITSSYVHASETLAEVAQAYFLLGRLKDAQHLLSTTLRLLEAREATPQPRLRLLLLYSQVLIVDHLLTRGETEPMFSIISQAQQVAEAIQDPQGRADALSLLGQAHCNATTIASLKNGVSPFVLQGQGRYDEELTTALAYQRQALQQREALNDTRGISESYFLIGLVHERWCLDEQAQDYYAGASQVAEESGHAFERTEPARHRALHALKQGKLDQALPLALQALKLREEAQFRPYQPLDHLLIRDIYLARGDTAKAQQHTEAASAIAAEMGMETLVASMPNIQDVLAAQHKEA
ncbi:hypothetical protein [Ktedonobacter racemifer]|uniref:MalT-like TPR region domain-containing protein n=1 Tax=Ktedonobacter racemifer DSM 44963 TaxID=485913 RepID=D6TS09_KTERA|nr:hypothetical protein [Ktedonobacter racemifer]EFH86082.1 hypothetical protein Krac_7351 [Ktedonobacter racemifer DSM 44963]